MASSSSSAPRQLNSMPIELGEDKKATLLFTVFMKSPEDFTPWHDDFVGALSTTGTDLVKALKEPKHPKSAIVRMLIKATVDRSLIDSFAPFCPTAADLYKQMATLWSIAAAGSADLYFIELSTIKMHKGEDMMALYSRFKHIVSLLTAAKQKPTDQQQLSFFLQALPPDYDTLLTVIRMSDPESVEDILTRLIQHEKRHNMQDNTLYGKALRTSGYSPSRSSLSSSNYRQQHQQYMPDSNRHRPYQQQHESDSDDDDSPYRGNSTFNGNCNYCKERGHMKRDCPKLAKKDKHLMVKRVRFAREPATNRDLQQQLDDIQSRLHYLTAALTPAVPFDCTFVTPY